MVGMEREQVKRERTGRTRESVRRVGQYERRGIVNCGCNFFFISTFPLHRERDEYRHVDG